MALRIKNAHVIDPKNNVLGQRMDLEMQDGKIVEKIAGKEVQEIDAGGRIVVAGGIDPHARLGSHVARLAGIYSKDWVAGSISREYLQAGYTFAANADVSLSDGCSTAHFLHQIKGVDSGMILSVGSLWMLALDYMQGNTNSIASTLAFFSTRLFPLAIQVSHPYAPEYWHWADENPALQTAAKHFEVNPEKVIVESLKGAKKAGFRAKCFVELPIDNQSENLPVLKTHLSRLDPEKLPYHLVHGHLYAQDTGRDDGASLANLLSEHSWVSADAGCGNLTKDKVFATTSRAFNKASTTIMQGTFELDQDMSVGLRAWNLRNKEDAQIWTSALELLLSGGERNLSLALSLDSPNFGLPHQFGSILANLASKSLRDKQAPAIVGSNYNKSHLKTMTTELHLEELVRLTRINPARILGIDAIKGHLAPGADADVCIFNLKPGDPIGETAFTESWVTVKGGQIVWQNKTLGPLPPSKIIASNINPETVTKDIVEKREKWYQKYSSINMASLHLPNADQIVRV